MNSINSILFALLITIFHNAKLSKCSLGENLLINGDFSLPDLISNATSWKLIPFSIPGWSCKSKCEIDNCKLLNAYFAAYSIRYGNCSAQVLDISSDKIQVITQIFKSQAGNHLLDVKFLLPTPVSNFRDKILLIYLNSGLVYRYQPSTLDAFSVYNFTSIVGLLHGNNNITFTMAGANGVYGFRLISVEVRRIIEGQDTVINSLIGNSASKGVIGFPGGRFLIGELMNVFVSLDRLQLYYYHNRNYSHYANLLLKNVASLLEMKGNLALNAENALFGQTFQSAQDYLSSLDYKFSYINQEGIAKSSNGYGFIASNANIFIYSLPYFAITLVIFCIFFRITFQNSFSIIFRKYSFVYASLLLMLCQNNIQQYSFYAFGEFKIFFSACLKHKISNCLIIVFFFFVLVVAISLYLNFWGVERRRVKYFAQNAGRSLRGIFFYTIDKGIVCIALGAAHSLLLASPQLQLLILASIEIIWIHSQLFGLIQSSYQRQLITWLRILDCFNRVLFQAMLWLYENSLRSVKDSSFINQRIHLTHIFVMISVWGVSFAVSLWGFLVDLIIFGRRLNRSQNNSSAPLEKNHTSQNRNFHKTVLTPEKIKSRFYHIFQRENLSQMSPQRL